MSLQHSANLEVCAGYTWSTERRHLGQLAALTRIPGENDNLKEVRVCRGDLTEMWKTL